MVQSLAAHLGRLPAGAVHVVLSDRETHESRFPPRAGEVLELEDLTEIPEDEREQVAQRYTWSFYAHGVTTHAAASHNPPDGVAIGDLAIYLDVDSVEAISEELDVLFEGLLGRVATHELAHAVRGHAAEAGRATHGWFREGDAQRDAWHVLNDLLTDSEWATVARWGRAAQVRLADRQPGAYRWFEADWAERSRLLSQRPADPPTAWIIRPPRAVFVLSQGGSVEVPVTDAARRILGAPCVGDHVYLSDSDMVVGPWVVVATRSYGRLSHPKDQAAIDQKAKEWKSKPQIAWLFLRPTTGMLASIKSDVYSVPELSNRELKPDEVARLAEQLFTPVDEVVATVADRHVEYRRKSAEQIARGYRDAGRPVPDGILGAYDPFDDWH